MRTIALRIAFVCLAASAAAAAQQTQDPRVELALPIALEEQEGDLAKAEQFYRLALEGKELSAAAHLLACQRLGRLLQKLGRAEEARPWLAQAAAAKGAVVSLDDVTTGQDPERERQLRQQARELVARIMGPGRRGKTGQLPGLELDEAEQLLWLGPAAVPEIVAVLEEVGRERKTSKNVHVVGMFAFLWRVGGPRASTFLVEAARNPNVSDIAADAAVFAQGIDVDAPAVRAFLEHEQWPITEQFLQHRDGKSGVAFMLDSDQLVTIAERGGAAMRGFVLRRLAGAQMLEPGLLARLHELAKTGLGGTDPDYGHAAESFLAAAVSQQSTEGLVLLLRQLPELHQKGLPVADRVDVSAPPRSSAQLDTARIAELIMEIDASVAAIGDRAGHQSPATRWLNKLMVSVLSQLPADEGMQHALAWWDGGYDVSLALRGKITAQNAADVVRRFERFSSSDPASMLDYFHGVELPRTMFASLRDLADATAANDLEVRPRLLHMLAQTGDERAADLIVAAWRNHAKVGDWAANCLWILARRNPAPPVLAAMRSMVRSFGGGPIGTTKRSQLLLALLSVGVEDDLDLVAAWLETAAVEHPYSNRQDSPRLTPLQYLIHREADPPHRFSPDQIVPRLRAAFENTSLQSNFAPDRQAVAAMPDVYLIEFAERAPIFRSDWQNLAVARLREQVVAGAKVSPMQDWFAQVLADPDGRDVMKVSPEVVRRFRDGFLQLIDGDDQGWSKAAVSALRDIGEPLDLVKLAGSRHASVRAWVAELVRDGDADVPDTVMLKLLTDPDVQVRHATAEYFGATVNKVAVPALISLLRDPDNDVRKLAADSLAKIRFYHEQQAHWDRILKGMDASPASAVEKLLLQAKPGSAKQQRLLAIASLGTLGLPEALPFLIDWTQEADAEVAETAKAAITAIHLNPRK